MTDARPESSGRPARRERVARALLWTQGGLALVGLACLAVWASACAQRTVVQVEEEERFDAQIIASTFATEEHDQSEWSPKRVAAYQQSLAEPAQAIARLSIESVGISVMVLEGTEGRVLDRAVGRIPGTALVGEDGNLGIAGHRDGFFRSLRHVKQGDEIRLVTVEGVSRYRIGDIFVVEPENVDVLEDTAEPTITLVTCFPFFFVGSAPRRFIVKGERISFEPWTQDTAAAYLGSDPVRW